jgi:hypothetical protein
VLEKAAGAVCDFGAPEGGTAAASAAPAAGDGAGAGHATAAAPGDSFGSGERAAVSARIAAVGGGLGAAAL